jgi:hypothetical protein
MHVQRKYFRACKIGSLVFLEIHSQPLIAGLLRGGLFSAKVFMGYWQRAVY